MASPEVEPKTAPENDVEMGFFEHLKELRSRLIRALVGVLPFVGACWLVVDHLLALMLAPLITAYEKLGLPTQIHFSNPVDPFVAKLKVAIIGGLLLGSPWVFWQVWGFIAPGLYRKEKLLAIPFVFFSTLCFSGGALFGYLIVFPMAFETLLGFGGELPGGIAFTPTLMISDVLTFITRMLLAFGAVFEVPVVVTFLAAADIVHWKQLLAFSRWWTVVAAVIASALTPPDVASMMMMFVPLIVLYMVSVGLAYLVQMRRKAPVAETEGTAPEL